MYMERNLGMEKGRLFLPTLFCQKIMGPGDEPLTSMAVMSKMGENRARIRREPTMSMVLLKTLKMKILGFKNNLDFLFIIFGHKEGFVFFVVDYLANKITNIEALLEFTNQQGIGGIDNGQIFNSDKANEFVFLAGYKTVLGLKLIVEGVFIRCGKAVLVFFRLEINGFPFTNIAPVEFYRYHG